MNINRVQLYSVSHWNGLFHIQTTKQRPQSHHGVCGLKWTCVWGFFRGAVCPTPLGGGRTSGRLGRPSWKTSVVTPDRLHVTWLSSHTTSYAPVTAMPRGRSPPPFKTADPPPPHTILHTSALHSTSTSPKSLPQSIRIKLYGTHTPEASESHFEEPVRTPLFKVREEIVLEFHESWELVVKVI